MYVYLELKKCVLLSDIVHLLSNGYHTTECHSLLSGPQVSPSMFSPLGPLRFSWAIPLCNIGKGERTTCLFLGLSVRV